MLTTLRFRKSSAVALCLILTACTVTRPPEQYQTSRRVSIEFLDDAREFCSRFTGQEAVACANRYLIWADNPCLYSDPYAIILCHELAHVNGWPAHHPNS